MLFSPVASHCSFLTFSSAISFPRLLLSCKKMFDQAELRAVLTMLWQPLPRVKVMKNASGGQANGNGKGRQSGRCDKAGDSCVLFWGWCACTPPVTSSGRGTGMERGAGTRAGGEFHAASQHRRPAAGVLRLQSVASFLSNCHSPFAIVRR